jgi:UDP-N-acetylglucosamine 2-epimerase (non-hydrolysing)
MKVMTVVGTRPELIRLSRVIPTLDKYCDHILVHTGQNYDPNLKDIFFEQLDIREPDYTEACNGTTPFKSIAMILNDIEKLVTREKPDKFFILGDTNSSLSAIVAKRYGVKVYHAEAGNRCYDDKVPEEVNRRIIDHSSDILMPYTERSKQNLIAEGIHHSKIFVTGNPILGVMKYYENNLPWPGIVSGLNIHYKEYFLVSMHRAENVDNKEILISLVTSLQELYKKYEIPVIMSAHPHTMQKLVGIDTSGILLHTPFNFMDFLNLEKNAFCVITDSGTVQEECCIQHAPNITIRTTTERPETVECGSNIVSGYKYEDILRCVDTVVNSVCYWNPPPEYMNENASSIISKIILGEYP